MPPRADPPPLYVLGGSDLSPGELPDEERDAGLHPLSAYKGAALSVQGRPLVCELAARFRASGLAGATRVAGPRRVYAGLDRELEVVDTDADVATNLRAAVEHFLAREGDGALAVVTCDVLPTAAELAELRALWSREEPALWFPLVRAPRDPRELGAFAWKPKYALRPERGAELVRVLPGHLVVAEPRALRLELLYRLISAAYRTRNKPVETRRSAMLRAALLGLLQQDLLHAVSLRVPNLTWVVVSNGLALARSLRAGDLTVAGLEQRVARILLTARHRRRRPEGGVRLPLVDALGLAEDVDTEEEARDAGLGVR